MSTAETPRPNPEESFDGFINSHTPREVREYLGSLPEEKINGIARAKGIDSQKMVRDILNKMSFIEDVGRRLDLGELTAEEFDEERDWRWKAMMGKLYIPSVRSIEAAGRREFDKLMDMVFNQPPK
jgi:hypothetical protein